jgi:RNA polymerase sigma factor (sigma-70 family)
MEPAGKNPAWRDWVGRDPVSGAAVSRDPVGGAAEHRDPVAGDPVDHLFRRESGRMVAALTRVFGFHNLALAEDVMQEALCRALEVWKHHGMPDNPSAWLMTTAKNQAVDVLRRERTARTFAPELSRLLESEWTFRPTIEAAFGPHAIQDDELRMMFSCVDPRLTEEAQVALILHILCGFSVNEISNAFLSSAAAIEKRITRAKKVLAGAKQLFELSGTEDFVARLSAVHRALYLLFNEGYHGSNSKTAVRVELCREALRLATLLRDHPLAATPATHALCALMCLHAARLPSRVDESGSLSLLPDQDRSQWDRQLITRGRSLLEGSATGEVLSEYHVEAAIAWCHACAASAHETNWAQIVTLYDMLMRIRPSPVVALNRAIAVAQHAGPEQGLTEIHAIAQPERLSRYPFYPIALGELEFQCGRFSAAHRHFTAALSLARNPTEQRFIEQRVSACTCQT